MPTKRLSKSDVDSQRAETKENISCSLLQSKVSGGRMARKRIRSDPGDSNNAAVLRVSQEANSSGGDNHVDAVEGTNVNDDGKEEINNSQRMNSARLYAQSLQNVSARCVRNSKKVKISSDPIEGKVISASVSACEQNLSEMYVTVQSASPAAAESTVSGTGTVLRIQKKKYEKLNMNNSQVPVNNST